MMTADEKNHVISNANEELDRQIVRLDTVFPYIAGEISEEARLGSLTHWAYSNKSTAKAATNERPRREAVNHRQDLAHALHEAEAASRSEARREAVLARKQRRAHVDADYEDTRAARKTITGKSRGDNATADQGAAAKRRKVERPVAMDIGTPMERSASGTGSQRVSSKDAPEKKRSRAPNPNTAAARKKYVCSLCKNGTQLTHPPRTNATSNAGSPVLTPLIGTYNGARGAASPGPNASRPQSSRTQQNAGQTSNSRQRPSSSASNRIGQPNNRMSHTPYPLCDFLTHLPVQPNPPIQDLQPATDPSKMKQPFQTHASMKARPAHEHPPQQETSAKTWTDGPPTLSRPKQAKGEPPRP